MLKLAIPEEFETTSVTGGCDILFISYDMVDVVPGSNPRRLIVACDPEQTVSDCEAPVSLGSGFTFTIIEYGSPVQVPVTETGVTRYSTVPGTTGSGLTSDWLIVVPAPGEAPVTEPVIVPIVHVKVHGTVAVRLMLVLVPVHTFAEEGEVTTGVGWTVTFADRKQVVAAIAYLISAEPPDFPVTIPAASI